MTIVSGFGQRAEVAHACRRPKLAGPFEPALLLPTRRLHRPGANRPAAPRNSEGSWVLWLLLIVGGVIVLSFLMRLLRGNSSSSTGIAQPPVLPGTSGGGGFFSSMLGGIGGAIAGSYIYDRFFSDHGQAADHWNSSSGDAPRSDVGGDYSSSGGDADGGGSSGGSDSGGGGDSGGSDF